MSTASDFRELLLALGQRMATALREDMSCCGVTVSQCYALQHLQKNEEMTAGDLARAMGVDASTVTRTADGLVKEGRVERVRPESGDRRRVLLRLTDEGRALADDLIHREELFFEQALGCFDEQAVRSAVKVIRGLLKMADAVQDQCSGCAPGKSDE